MKAILCFLVAATVFLSAGCEVVDVLCAPSSYQQPVVYPNYYPPSASPTYYQLRETNRQLERLNSQMNTRNYLDSFRAR